MPLNICVWQAIFFAAAEYLILTFWSSFLETFLFVDRLEQNLHSICKMKNKIYFYHVIFPAFFVVFFLFTILWTNCNKIVFTQIPKALSVLVLGKNKECYGKPDKFRKFSLAVFFLISISFFHKFYQKLLYIKTQIPSNYPPFPPPPNCGKTKSNLKKRAR